MRDDLRVPVSMIEEIMEDLSKTPIEQTWHFSSAGGSELTVRRRQSQDQYGDHDWIDFIWNEHD